MELGPAFILEGLDIVFENHSHNLKAKHKPMMNVELEAETSVRLRSMSMSYRSINNIQDLQVIRPTISITFNRFEHVVIN